MNTLLFIFLGSLSVLFAAEVEDVDDQSGPEPAFPICPLSHDLILTVDEADAARRVSIHILNGVVSGLIYRQSLVSDRLFAAEVVFKGFTDDSMEYRTLDEEDPVANMVWDAINSHNMAALLVIVDRVCHVDDRSAMRTVRHALMKHNVDAAELMFQRGYQLLAYDSGLFCHFTNAKWNLAEMERLVQFQ